MSVCDNRFAWVMRILSNLTNLFRIVFVIFFSQLPFISLKLLLLKDVSKRKKCIKGMGAIFANIAHKCGPIFIKFAQAISMRPDLIGEEFASGLSQVQDKMPPFDTKYALDVLERELKVNPYEIFSEIEERPVAAASIAQVHKAVTKDKQVVAIKILRPDIEKIFARDIEFLRFLISLGKYLLFKKKKIVRLKLDDVIDGLSKTTELELDLRMEAAASDKIKESFSEKEDGILIPKVYWNHTTKKILVTQWVDGIPIYEVDQLKKANYNLHDIVKRLAYAFFKQAFDDGIFHADLHAGNVLIDAKQNVVFLDFGIVGYLSRDDRLYIAQMIHGFVTKDYDMVSRLHFDAGYVDDAQDQRLFAMAIRSIGEPIINLPVNQISIGRLLKQLFDVTEMFNMRTQTQLILLQKSIVIVEGMAGKLYPDVNLWQLTQPYMEKWAKKHLGLRKAITDILQEKDKFKHKVISFPDHLEKISNKLSCLVSVLEAKQEKRKRPYKILSFCAFVVAAVLVYMHAV